MVCNTAFYKTRTVPRNENRTELTDTTVFTYKEIMQLVLKYSGLQGRRLILSLPYWVGMIQGFFLEKLPESLFTVTRDQVSLVPYDPAQSVSQIA